MWRSGARLRLGRLVGRGRGFSRFPCQTRKSSIQFNNLLTGVLWNRAVYLNHNSQESALGRLTQATKYNRCMRDYSFFLAGAIQVIAKNSRSEAMHVLSGYCSDKE